MPSRNFADISSNNSEFDAELYKATGHILVAIKATEGTTYTNPDHRGWCLGAGGKHIGVVHYHFARPDLGTDPAAEAAHFLREALPLAGWRDYLVLDLERAVAQGFAHDPAWCTGFDTYVREHSRFKIILYASESVLRLSDAWLQNQPKRVWDAAWGSGPDYAPPGYECVFRQFTDGVFGPEPHSLPGVGNCDVNRMSLSMFHTVLAHSHR